MIGPPTCRQIVAGRVCGGETAIHSTDPDRPGVDRETGRILSRQCLSCGHVKMDEPNGKSREQLYNERERTPPKLDDLGKRLREHLMTEPSDDD